MQKLFIIVALLTALFNGSFREVANHADFASLTETQKLSKEHPQQQVDYSQLLQLTKKDITLKFGKNYEEGTTTIEQSHIIFPTIYYPKEKLTFVFGDEQENSSVRQIIVAAGEIQGVTSGMNFAEIKSRLGLGEVQETWLGTEDNLAYKLEYQLNGLTYSFISTKPDGRASELVITEGK
ncbi:hypothetical protein Elgi_11120 [Paenibacillus elgii]|uniref:hypothetical protein n=1 Tax=Paenibacillus elgii TaxID=189691 RepID=UPI002D7DCAE6|nr:hypothetical protein Elgi_11120 [Paenibacillus elgii]